MEKPTTNLFMMAIRLILAAVILSGSGCKPDDSSSGPFQGSPVPEELLGTWRFESVTVGGSAASLREVLSWASNTVSAEFTVAATGLLTYRELDGNGAQTFTKIGSISISGQRFTLVLSPVLLSGEWALSGSQLVLTGIQGGQTVVFTAVKPLWAKRAAL
jgi:hypothetical protein